MKITYSEDVKAILRASGMTDAQIKMNELKASIAGQRILDEPVSEPDPENTLAKKYASSYQSPLADYSN